MYKRQGRSEEYRQLLVAWAAPATDEQLLDYKMIVLKDGEPWKEDPVSPENVQYVINDLMGADSDHKFTF